MIKTAATRRRPRGRTRSSSCPEDAPAYSRRRLAGSRRLGCGPGLADVRTLPVPGAVLSCGGNTTIAGRQSGNPSRQRRSVGCRWPSSMNFASSASEIGPNCWPSRARYHCACEPGGDISFTGSAQPLGGSQPGNSSASRRQSSRNTTSYTTGCGQAMAVIGPFSLFPRSRGPGSRSCIARLSKL